MIQDLLLRTQVATLYKEGWDATEIAEELDLPIEEVVAYCNKLI